MSVKELEDAIHELGVEQKLGLMETIWADLTWREDNYPSPVWHNDVLDERQHRLDRGESVPMNLDDAITEIHRRTGR